MTVSRRFGQQLTATGLILLDCQTPRHHHGRHPCPCHVCLLCRCSGKTCFRQRKDSCIKRLRRTRPSSATSIREAGLGANWIAHLHRLATYAMTVWSGFRVPMVAARRVVPDRSHGEYRPEVVERARVMFQNTKKEQAVTFNAT